MPWTTPKTWTSEPLTSSDLNTHLRDNLDYLKNPPEALKSVSLTSDYAIATPTFTPVDSGNLSFTLTTAGGTVMIGFFGVVTHSNATVSSRVNFDVEVNNSRISSSTSGLVSAHFPVTADRDTTLSFVRLVPNLPANTPHTFTLVWRRTGAGTATLFAAAGTTNRDFAPQFWVREV